MAHVLSVYAAMRAADAADEAWHAALVRAFGSKARERRYDLDTSHHPEECRRLRRAFFAALLKQDAAWKAARPFVTSVPELVQ